MCQQGSKPHSNAHLRHRPMIVVLVLVGGWKKNVIPYALKTQDPRSFRWVHAPVHLPLSRASLRPSMAPRNTATQGKGQTKMESKGCTAWYSLVTTPKLDIWKLAKARAWSHRLALPQAVCTGTCRGRWSAGAELLAISIFDPVFF